MAGSNVRAGNTSTQIVNFGGFTVSQFPSKPVSGAANAIKAIPSDVVGVVQYMPFGLRFTGLWHFHAVSRKWRPRMLLTPLAKGASGQSEADLGLELKERANAHPSMRFYLNEDSRLGKYSNFLKTYPVRVGRSVFTHYALFCESYVYDKSGRLVRRVDNAMLNGLFEHVVKAGYVLEPSPSQLHKAVQRINMQIRALDSKLTVRGAPTDELEIRRGEKVRLREDMIAAFAEQFPNADKCDDDDDDSDFEEAIEAGQPAPSATSAADAKGEFGDISALPV